MDITTVPKQTPYDFSFGVDPKRLSAALHTLADDIAAGRVIPQQVRLIQRADVEDFCLQSLIVRFCEKTAPPSPPDIPG